MIPARPQIAALVGLSLAEQAVASGSNFIFVIALARIIGPAELGAFSVVWALVYLFESTFWNYTGEPVPSVAFRIPRSAWPALRTGLLRISVLIVIGLIAMTLALAVVLSPWPQAVGPILGGGYAAISLRCQQLFRRICYLDDDRVLALISAVICGVVLFAGCAAFFVVGELGATTALVCWGTSLLAGSSLLAVRRQRFGSTSRRFRAWLAGRLSRQARWLVGSAVLYWVTNMSLIPLGGLLFGLEAAGAFRLLQTLFSPLQQAAAAIMTVLSPRVAERLRDRRQSVLKSLALRVSVLLGGMATAYSVIAIFAGDYLLTALFPSQKVYLHGAAIMLFSVSAVADALRQSLSTILVSIQAPQVLLWSRLTGAILVSLVILLGSHLGFVALPLALAVSAVGGYWLVFARVLAIIRGAASRRD